MAREIAIESAKRNMGTDEIEVIDSYFEDYNPENGCIPLKYLAKSLELLADADVAYFVPGWENARGCKIENQAAIDEAMKAAVAAQKEGIAAQQARSVIVQTIKEEEKKALFEHFYCKEKDVVTGVVQRYVGKNISISLDDKMDALLMENEQIKGEHYRPTDRIKLYIVEVKETNSSF